MAVTVKQVNSTLYQFLKNAVNQAQTHTVCEEATGITKAVNKLVSEFAIEISRQDSRFKISEILHVGSSNEGTKILKPDEFDYLVVLDELSKPGILDTIVIDGVFDGRVVSLCVIDDSLKERWPSDENFLTDFIEQSKPHVEEDEPPREDRQDGRFYSTVKNVFNDLAEQQNIDRDPNDNCHCCTNNGIRFSSVTEINIDLQLVGIDTPKTPNVILSLLYNGTEEISVDFTPAVRYFETEKCFEMENCLDSSLAASVLNRGSILLVCHRFEFFKITFTETEVEYVKSMNHKHIYIFLKLLKYVILKDKQESFQEDTFSSYLLKMSCMRHDFECREPEKIELCLSDVKRRLQAVCKSGYLPSPFNREYKIYHHKYTTIPCGKTCIEFLDTLEYFISNSNTLPESDTMNIEEIESYIKDHSTEVIYMRRK